MNFLRCNLHAIKFTILECTIQWYFYFIRLYITTKSRTSCHPQKKAYTHRQSLPSLSLQPLLTTNLLSVSVCLPIPDILSKWNHVICSRYIHPSIGTSFLFGLNNIPMCGYTTIYPFISTSVHPLCYFHCFVIMNKAATDILVQVFVLKYAFNFLGIYLGVELLGHLVTLCLTFWETVCFLPQVHHVTIPPAMPKVSNLFTSPWIIVIISFILLLFCHPNGCEVVSCCAFDLYFPYD